MAIYIWLKDDAKGKIEKLKEEGALGEFLRLENDSGSNKPYICIYQDIFDPAVEFPDIPEELIKRVSLKEAIHEGFRPEGIYRDKNAELSVKTNFESSSEMYGGDRQYQDISAVAPTIEELKEIHTNVRQGKLFPEENWGNKTPPVSLDDVEEDENQDSSA